MKINYLIQTIYSENFIVNLKKELGSYKDFIKYNKKERENVSKKIKNIFAIEDFNKKFSDKTIYNSLVGLNIIFKDEKKIL